MMGATNLRQETSQFNLKKPMIYLAWIVSLIQFRKKLKNELLLNVIISVFTSDKRIIEV